MYKKVRLVTEPHQQLIDYVKGRKSSMQAKNIKLQAISKQWNRNKYGSLDHDNDHFEKFLRNEQHISAQSDPLDFRSLPRNLKVFFPGPPNPPPTLLQIPYTYQRVELVPFKMPKQKKGTVGSWVLEHSGFIERNKSVNEQKQKEGHLRIRKQISQKKIGIEESSSINQTRRKSIIKKASIYSNNRQFFQLIKANRKEVEYLLQRNQYLAYDVDEFKMTALHLAANAGHLYLIIILLQKFRANPEARDIYGRTPLHIAASKGFISCIVRIFIQGGSLKAIDNQKRDVMAVAPDENIRHLLEKLQQVQFIIRSKGYRDAKIYRSELERHVKYVLSQSSIYFE